MVQGVVLTKEACQSSLGKEEIGWEVGPSKAEGSLRSSLAILKRHLVHPTPKLIQSQKNKEALSLLPG